MRRIILERLVVPDGDRKGYPAIASGGVRGPFRPADQLLPFFQTVYDEASCCSFPLTLR